MIDLPMNVEVHCSDSAIGFSTYMIVNPISHQMTHLVVQSDLPPNCEYLMPVELVEEITPTTIKMNCTLEEFFQMELFIKETFIPTEMPSQLSWPYCVPIPGAVLEEVAYIPVEHENIPRGEFAVRSGARVEASDGTIGQVDELLINATNMEITHLVLRGHPILKHKEITIPVSQIESVDENTVYLKLDRQSVEALPTTPIHHWLQYD